jgi:hypothetical protein
MKTIDEFMYLDRKRSPIIMCIRFTLRFTIFSVPDYQDPSDTEQLIDLGEL